MKRFSLGLNKPLNIEISICNDILIRYNYTCKLIFRTKTNSPKGIQFIKNIILLPNNTIYCLFDNNTEDLFNLDDYISLEIVLCENSERGHSEKRDSVTWYYNQLQMKIFKMNNALKKYGVNDLLSRVTDDSIQGVFSINLVNEKIILQTLSGVRIIPLASIGKWDIDFGH